jgi:hypothetical protein
MKQSLLLLWDKTATSPLAFECERSLFESLSAVGQQLLSSLMTTVEEIILVKGRSEL